MMSQIGKTNKFDSQKMISSYIQYIMGVPFLVGFVKAHIWFLDIYFLCNLLGFP